MVDSGNTHSHFAACRVVIYLSGHPKDSTFHGHKKSELYSSLWQSCDELRGGMDASQYKDYVLVLLFVKYVSDKYAGVPYPRRSQPYHGTDHRYS